MQYVITYDNGTGFREWASAPQLTSKLAWEMAGIKPGEEFFTSSFSGDSSPLLERVVSGVHGLVTADLKDEPGYSVYVGDQIVYHTDDMLEAQALADQVNGRILHITPYFIDENLRFEAY